MTANVSSNNTSPNSDNTTLPNGDVESRISALENDIGGIIGAVFGILFGVALTIAALYVYRKHRRRLNEEYERELNVIRSSHNNAGVYRDTTVPTDSLVPAQKQVTSDVRISLTQNPDLYENDSDDEF